MRKLIGLLFSFVMLISLVSPAIAGEHYIDYRGYSIILPNDTEAKKPIAMLSIDVMNSLGEIKASAETAKNEGKDIVSNTPAPVIQAVVGDTLQFTDKSTPSVGRQLIAWDWQYWTEDQQIFELKNKMDKELKLTIPGRYHFYLCVGDNMPVKKSTNTEDFWLWDYNWSENGNHRAVKELDKQFTGWEGYWYFQEIIVEVSAEAPDFYITPEGSREWEQSYLTCAKTYTGNPGESISFPVTLHNAGTEAITDFRAVWSGQGSDPETGWQGNNPAWEAEELTSLAKGESKIFNVTVTFPEQNQKLYFKTNIDGKNPESETNLENNLMAIYFQKPGVDLAISVETAMPEMEMGWWGDSAIEPFADAYVSRLDDGTEPVTAEVTLVSPGGTSVEIITISPGEIVSLFMNYPTNKAGNYKFSASVTPVDKEDTDTSNNWDSCMVTVVKQAEPERQDSDSGIRGGFTG